MKHSPKSPPPSAYMSWLAEANEDWLPTYDGLSGPPMIAVRAALLQEQGFVCCYCGRSLPADSSDGHIDHFWPQAVFDGVEQPDRRLDYNNFFRSCGPPGQLGVPKQRPSTCGDAKGHWFDLVNYVIPSDPLTEARFQYGQTGLVQATDTNDLGALNMIEKLALNEPSLMLEREALIQGLEDAIAGGGLSPADEIIRWRTRMNGKLPNFGHVLARYLEDEFELDSASDGL